MRHLVVCVCVGGGGGGAVPLRLRATEWSSWNTLNLWCAKTPHVPVSQASLGPQVAAPPSAKGAEGVQVTCPDGRAHGMWVRAEHTVCSVPPPLPSPPPPDHVRTLMG